MRHAGLKYELATVKSVIGSTGAKSLTIAA
jgi:hypothetical protein